ncbi:MAG: type II secretion system protein [Candidatus Pacebacteria bacterium]|nr:type II secretion system protein [Candidatus Paceibacterota bacterium]
MKKNRNKTKESGFTLVEMIVSTGIFVMVLSASVGGLLTMVNANNKAQALRVAMDNMNFTMEEMSRHITQGHTYYCNPGVLPPSPNDPDPLTANSCFGGDDELYFLSNKDAVGRVYYGLLNNEIIKSTTDETGAYILEDVPLTNSNVLTITNLKFFVDSGDGASGESQPKVLVSISGEVSVAGEMTEFHVQTTVVQRIPKIN